MIFSFIAIKQIFSLAIKPCSSSRIFAAMTVQFIGGARLLETTIGISYTQALLLFALTVGIYTFIGDSVPSY